MNKILVALLAVAVVLLGILTFKPSQESSIKVFGATGNGTTAWSSDGSFAGDLAVGGALATTGATTLTGGAKVGSQFSATNPLQFLNATATAPSANYCNSAAEGGSIILATSTTYVRLYVCSYHASTTRGWDYSNLTN